MEKQKEHKNSLFSIPNCLCYFRILLIPIYIYVYFHAKSSTDYLIAMFILIISGITDFLDGYIARKYDMVTDFGKIIDPVADKLTQFTIAITLLYSYPLMWVLLIIIIVKDGMIALVGFYLYEYGCKVKGASWWGKIATAYFYVIVIILVGFHIPETIVADLMIVTCSALMFLSFVLYAKQLVYIYQHRDEDKYEK